MKAREPAGLELRPVAGQRAQGFVQQLRAGVDAALAQHEKGVAPGQLGVVAVFLDGGKAAVCRAFVLEQLEQAGGEAGVRIDVFQDQVGLGAQVVEEQGVDVFVRLRALHQARHDGALDVVEVAPPGVAAQVFLDGLGRWRRGIAGLVGGNVLDAYVHPVVAWGQVGAAHEARQFRGAEQAVGAVLVDAPVHAQGVFRVGPQQGPAAEDQALHGGAHSGAGGGVGSVDAVHHAGDVACEDAALQFVLGGRHGGHSSHRARAACAASTCLQGPRSPWCLANQGQVQRTRPSASRTR